MVVYSNSPKSIANQKAVMEYLQRAGLNVAVVEKNAWVGGAATSRELSSGVTYSNCSYVSSLFRPEINHWNGLTSLELVIDFWVPA